MANHKPVALGFLEILHFEKLNYMFLSWCVSGRFFFLNQSYMTVR